MSRPITQVWLIACVLLAPFGRAQDEPSGPEAEAAKKFQAYARETAAGYDARIDSAQGRKLSLMAEPILRWANPLGGRKAHGEVFLWTDGGRPAAVLSLYEFTDGAAVVHEHHEFSSLSEQGLFISSKRPLVWSPAEAGIDLKPLPGAPAPAASRRQRLTQMRAVAEKFSGEKTTRQDETRALRILPRPVFRYAAADEPQAEEEAAGTIDGALFAFVEATDPEIFLWLEARDAEDKPAWHFAAVRMNSIRLALSHDGKPAWEVDVLPWREALNRRDLPYTAFQVR
jgi:hypothetical protein